MLVFFIVSVLLWATVGLPDPVWAWVGVVVAAAYTVGFCVAGGQTPGKMALRIRVRRTDGSPVSPGRAVLRCLVGYPACAITLGLGFLMIAYDVEKQGFHDRIADTCVVET